MSNEVPPVPTEEAAPKSRRVAVDDPELVAMHRVQKEIEHLSPAAAVRVLRWNAEKVSAGTWSLSISAEDQD